MLLYNGRFILVQDFNLPLTNRAFQYGDGFFETMMVVNGRLRFWGDHKDRMREAAESLKLELPAYINEPEFEQQLLQLAEQNSAATHGRLKLKVWRAGAGLYTPETNAVDWLATAAEASASTPKSITIGICQSIKTVYSPLSHFKGPNAAVYTLASIERKNTSFDDMVILSAQGMVSELTSSNIFWFLDGKLFTPALDSGCVNGIARRNIIRWCNSQGIKVCEAYFTPQRLFNADAVFAANVTGIKSIESINGSILQSHNIIVDALKSELGL